MEKNKKFWLFCPTCGETIPEIYISSNQEKDYIDIRCNCDTERVITLDPKTYVEYCESSSKSIDENINDINKKPTTIENNFCLHCKKWLTDFEYNLHNKILFSYPHLLTNCNINIGSFCEEKDKHHPLENIPSKFYCDSHGVHICETCNTKYHEQNESCIVHSLEAMRRKVNELYKTLHLQNNEQKRKSSLNQTQTTKNEMRNLFSMEMINNSLNNNNQWIKDIIYNLFRLYLFISEAHYPNYNLAKSILNLDMKTNVSKNDKQPYQINLTNTSINYYQVMNYFPYKNIYSHSNIVVLKDQIIPFSSEIFLLQRINKQHNQIVFINDNTFKIGGIYSIIEEPKPKIRTAKRKQTPILSTILHSIPNVLLSMNYDNNNSPKEKIKQGNIDQHSPSSFLLTNIKNLIGNRLSLNESKNNVRNQDHMKLILHEQEGITPTEGENIQNQHEELDIKDDQLNGKQLLLEINYKQISKNIKILSFIKCNSDDKIAAFCSEKEGNKCNSYIKIFSPIIKNKNDIVIGYEIKNDKKDYFSKQIKNDFSDFKGLCQYSYQHREKDIDWSFLCFGNQILKITIEEGKKIQIEIKARFKEIFKDTKLPMWNNFTHFIPIPIAKGTMLKNISLNKEYFLIETIHLVLENSKTYSAVHSFMLEDKVIHKKIIKTKTPSALSICYFPNNSIAIGGITNEIEIYTFDFVFKNELKVKVDKKKGIEILKTQHRNGIYCICIIRSWFITGGGNGTFIIWSIKSRQMLNVIIADEGMMIPVINVMLYSCSFGENTLCVCLKGKGLCFWASESDMDERDRKQYLSD